jgi:CHAT domain-containing protein/tetratricopeptide (TPR) repeat protein
VAELNERTLEALLAQDTVRARPLAERAQALAVQNLQPSDPEYVLALSRLASLRFAERREAEALELLERALPTAGALGPTDPEYAALLNNLAACYARAGREAEAVPLFHSAIESKRRLYDAGSLSYIANLQDLVLALEKLDRYAEAEPHIREMVEMIVLHAGEKSPEYVRMLGNLARACRDAGKEAEAEELFRRAEQIQGPAQEEDGPPGADLAEQARRAYAAGDFARARQLHRHLLATLPQLSVLQHIEDVLGPMLDPLRADINKLDRQGLAAEEAKDYEAATHAYRQVLEMMRVSLGEQHPDLAKALSNLALVCQKQGRYDAAKALFGEAVRLLGGAVQKADWGDKLLINIANLFTEICDRMAPSPGDDLEGALTGVKDKPEDYATSLVFQFPRPVEGEDEVQKARRWLAARARFYASLGDRQRARLLYEAALEMIRLAWPSQPEKLFDPIRELAQCCIEHADYPAASALVAEAARIADEAHGPDSPEVVLCQRMRAQIAVQIADYEGAEQAILKGLETVRRRGEEDGRDARILNDDLLVIRLRRGDHEGAQELLRTKLAELEEGAEEDIDPEELQRLGAFAAQAEDFALSERLLRTALARLEESVGKWAPSYALALSNLGSTLRLTGRFDEAAECFRRAAAVRTARFGPDHVLVAQSKIRLALALAALGRPEEALEAIQDALRIGDGLIASVSAVSSQQQLFLLLREQRKALDVGLSVVVRLLKRRPDQGSAAYQMVLRRKALSADALAARRLPLLSDRHPGLQEQLHELNDLTSRIVSARLSAKPSRQEDLVRAARLRDRLEEELARAIPELGLDKRLERATPEEVCRALPADAALVEYVRYEPDDFQAVASRGERKQMPTRYLAFVIQPGSPGVIHLLDLGEAEPIERCLDDFGRRVARSAGAFPRHLLGEDQDVPDSAYLEAGGTLYNLVFKPVASFLNGKDRLLLAPDGGLSLLAFDVLPTASDRFVIDDYRISYLGTGRDLLRLSEVPAVSLSTPVVVAGPDYDLRGTSVSATGPSQGERGDGALRSLQGQGLALRPLPGAAAEGREVAALLERPQLLSGPDALEATVRAWKSPVLVHLATHGFYLPEGPRGGEPWETAQLEPDGAMIASGLALAGANAWLRGEPLPAAAEDGFLTAEDVATLNMVGTHLVVLSACHSGVGAIVAGEGVFGLRRAFFAAGARALVLSLWQVPDAETRELMVAFYRELRRGIAKPEALRQARLALRQRRAHPFYWGSFLCEGDWAALPASAFSSPQVGEDGFPRSGGEVPPQPAHSEDH